jgi:tetratricopeptide (TPR) repeat protein
LSNTDCQHLREQIRALGPDNWPSRQFQEQALAATNAGDLDETKLLLDGYIEARSSAVSAANKLLRNVAAAEAALGWIAMVQSRYSDAAEHFRFAFRLLPEKEIERRLEYRRAEVDSYYRQAQEHADEGALRQAISLSKPLLRQMSRAQILPQWVTLQNRLGAALQKIGERNIDTVWLEEAAAAYCGILEVLPRQDAPLEWAMTQNNLGLTLLLLGERQSSVGQLEKACAAFRAALEERTRKRVPFDWAVTQTNLGNVLFSLSTRESGTARLKEAVTAYRYALDLFQAAQASNYADPIKVSLAEAERLLAERARGRKSSKIMSFRMKAAMLSKIRTMLGKVLKVPRLGLRKLPWRRVAPSPPPNPNTPNALSATSATNLVKQRTISRKGKDDPNSLGTSESVSSHQVDTKDSNPQK